MHNEPYYSTHVDYVVRYKDAQHKERGVITSSGVASLDSLHFFIMRSMQKEPGRYEVIEIVKRTTVTETLVNSTKTEEVLCNDTLTSLTNQPNT